MVMLSDEQAYAAMYCFLKEAWTRCESVEVKDLLSWCSLLPDGSPADPAMSDDWRRAVSFAVNGGKADALVLKRQSPDGRS